MIEGISQYIVFGIIWIVISILCVIEAIIYFKKYKFSNIHIFFLTAFLLVVMGDIGTDLLGSQYDDAMFFIINAWWMIGPAILLCLFKLFNTYQEGSP